MKDLITLRLGSWVAKIAPHHGANCISLRNTELGLNILRERPETDKIDNPYIYGMPLLFPQNRISGGKFTFEGREYSFPINEQATGCHLHGELHDAPFAVSELGESFVKCVYEAKNGEYLSFPHSFKITVSYELSDDGLTQAVTVLNTSEENMPIFLAFHTTFNVPFSDDAEGCDISILTEVSEEIERDMSVYLPTGRILCGDDVLLLLNRGEFVPTEHSVSRHYKTYPKGKIKLTDRRKNISIVYDTDEKYLFRLVYNAASPEFICIEPQTSAADAPNSPLGREYSGFDYTKPGRSKEYISRIYLERK